MTQPQKTDIVEIDEEDRVDLEPLLGYLQSPQGHELASRVVGIVEDIKKATLDKTIQHAVFEKKLQLFVILAVILSSSVLGFFGKFDTSLGVLFGTMVGYIFGRK